MILREYVYRNGHIPAYATMYEIKFLDFTGKMKIPDELELVNVENKAIELERFLLNEI